MNPEDSSLVLLKAHGFENVTSLGKSNFEPLNAICKMSYLLCTGLPFLVCVSARFSDHALN